MNFRPKKHSLCSSRKLYSSLNVTLTYFLDQSMNHKLRGNKVFCCWFFVSSMEATLSSTSNLIGWCFLFCPFTHFIWNYIYVTLTLAFYAWQRATYLGISFWYRNLSSFLRVKFRGQFTALSFLKTWSKLKMQNDVLNIARSTKKSSNWLLQSSNSKDRRS